MILFQLTLNHLISFVGLITGLGLGLYGGRIVLESIQVALSIDEAITQVAAPNLNRSLLEKALEAMGSTPTGQVQGVMTGTPLALSVPFQVKVVHTVAQDIFATPIGSIFGSMAQVSLENTETELDETRLLYKNGYSTYVEDWKQQLEELGWPVGSVEVLAESETVEVKLQLGKQSAL